MVTSVGDTIEQGAQSLEPLGQIRQDLVINKVLSAGVTIHLFICCSWQCLSYNGEQNRCDRDCNI